MEAFSVQLRMMEGHAPSWPQMLDTGRSQAGEDHRQGKITGRDACATGDPPAGGRPSRDADELAIGRKVMGEWEEGRV